MAELGARRQARRLAVLQPVEQFAERVLGDGGQHRVLVGEMHVKRGGRHPDRGADAPHGNLRYALLGEQMLGRGQYLAAAGGALATRLAAFQDGFVEHLAHWVTVFSLRR